MKIFRIIIVIICFLCQSGSIMSQNTIYKIVIYKNFWNAGTTNSVLNMFKDPRIYKIDTTNVNCDLISTNAFEQILKVAKKRKHFQMKITGISFAGELLIGQHTHFFVVCSTSLIIDLTDKINYVVQSEEDKKALNEMIRLLNKDQK